MNGNIKNYTGEYYIGLDIGTNSVGWAVADDKLNLLKFNGRHMWGSRLFDSAETAKNRRIARCSRRRYVRRNIRLGLLRELFKPIINDDDFFQRIDESFYQLEDRTQKNRSNLFDGLNYTDQNYYDEFPTIYHLRNALINNAEKRFSPKLIYLAVHHIIKYRGNFLYDNLNATNDENITDKLANIIEMFDDLGCPLHFEKSLPNVILLLLDKKLSNKGKINQLKTTPQIEQFLKLCLGQKANLQKLFNDLDEKIELNFSNEKYAEIIDGVPEYSDILYETYSFYNLIQYKKIMKTHNYISEEMLERYNQFGKDLQQLRTIFKRYLDKKEYHAYFRDLDAKEDNFARYTTRGGNCNRENFYKALKRKLENIKSLNNSNLELINEINSILDRIDNDQFLLKLRIKENGVFPKQVHKAELEKILDNQAKFYPYLNEIKQKVLTLFEFKIDYYVGPLAKRNANDFGWIIRKPGYENQTITPFNYNEAIDFDACQMEFIERMTGECTYIWGEKALPLNSIYYSLFNVYNEINNIRYKTQNGVHSLPKNVRDKILDRLHQTNTVKKKDIEKFLEAEIGEYFEITLSSDKLNNNLKPLRDFTRILGKIDNTNIELIEEVIKWLTIFKENKKLLQIKIKNKYGNVLSDEQIKSIISLNYSGWGRLSKKLIVDLKTLVGERHLSILDLLNMPDKQSNYQNFQSIYNDARFSFKQNVELSNSQAQRLSPKDAIDKLACSPAIKRGIYQAYKIINEIIKTAKRPPKQIFIEFAREEGQKGKAGQKDSRQKQLQQKYNEIKKTAFSLYDSLDEKAIEFLFKDMKADEFNERYLLYYLQNGKCAYSGQPLDISNLNLYQIDHIIPRSVIKDDSIDNKVLVISHLNQKKKDDLVVPEEIRSKMLQTWLVWRECGLITPEKFMRLTRFNLSDNDLCHFINRQIVETRQIIKNTADILVYLFNNLGQQVEIKPVRAQLNSDFREEFGYFKGIGGREINDFHHAKDAYISIFAGKYIDCNFPNRSTIYSSLHTQYNSQAQPHTYSNILKRLQIGDIIWNNLTLTNRQALENFEKNYYYSDIYCTKMTSTKTDGELFDGTRYKSEKNSKKFGAIYKTLIPLKKKIDKTDYLPSEFYGGYSSEKPAYYALISIKDKKQTKIKLKNIPIRYVLQDKSKVLDYLINFYPKNEIKLLKIVPKFQKFHANIGFFGITGDSDVYQTNQFIIGRKNKQLYEFIYHVYNDMKTKKFENTSSNEIQLNEYFEENYQLFKKVYLNYINNYFINDNLIRDKINQGFNEYENQNLNNKITFIKNLLIISHCNTEYSTEIKTISRKLSNLAIDLSDASLIYQSPTGMHTKVIKIKDIKE